MTLDYDITDEELSLFLKSGIVLQPNESKKELMQRLRHLKELESTAKHTPRKEYIFDFLRNPSLSYSDEEQKKAVEIISLNRKFNHEIALETKKLVKKYMGIENMLFPSKIILLRQINSLGMTILDVVKDTDDYAFPELILVRDAPNFLNNAANMARLMHVASKNDLLSCEDYFEFEYVPKVNDNYIDNTYTWLAVYHHSTKEKTMMHEALHSAYFSNKKINVTTLNKHTLVSEAISFKLASDSILITTLNDINRKYRFFKPSQIHKMEERFIELNSEYTKNILLNSTDYNTIQPEQGPNAISFEQYVSKTVAKLDFITQEEELDPTGVLFRCLKESLI